MDRLRKIKKKELGVVTVEEKRFKRRKPKGPNPLSCKKKKKKHNARGPLKSDKPATSDQAQPTKRRKRVKIAEHIRQELASRVHKP